MSKEGNTTSHVFRGLVGYKCSPAVESQKAKGKWCERMNRSGWSTGQGERKLVVVSAAKTADFIREIPKRTIKILDLVDVVAGGDGFSGRRNRGIDPTSGRTSDTPGEPTKDAELLVGDGKYHRVEALPFVDGVFIPDGRLGQVQVDSAGHAFAGFPIRRT